MERGTRKLWFPNDRLQPYPLTNVNENKYLHVYLSMIIVYQAHLSWSPNFIEQTTYQTMFQYIALKFLLKDVLQRSQQIRFFFCSLAQSCNQYNEVMQVVVIPTSFSWQSPPTSIKFLKDIKLKTFDHWHPPGEFGTWGHKGCNLDHK